ncbi:MAG: peptidyl-prolyl cis-trans isomerase [Candidatus Pacebacteria bacterium]|nr:peptidyl-prolyl cis-trans isomerase [Candidatus Paceibacterota bacterium]
MLLQAIRGRAGSWVVKGLFILLSLSFVAWGFEGFIGQVGSGNKILTVGSTVYDPNSFGQMMDRQVKNIEKQVGGTFNRSQLRQLGIYDQAKNRIIDSALIEQEAKHLGVVAGDKTINLILRSSPGMVRSDGSLDSARLLEVIRQSGYANEEAFVKNLRSQIATGTLMRAVASINVAPSVMIDQMGIYRYQQRSANYVTINDSLVAVKATPTAAEIAKYHQDHAEEFSAPEYRTVNYALLDPAVIVKEVKATEADLRKDYEDNIAQYSQAERRTVLQILFTDEAAATKAADGLKGKNGAAGTAAFNALAKQEKVSANDLSLGSLSKKELPEVVADSAFSLALGETSRPIKTDFGWNLVHISKVTAATVQSFESVQNRLKPDYLERKAIDLLYDRVNRIEAALDGGANFASIAAQYSLTIKSVGPMDETGLDTGGSRITALAGKEIDQGIPTDRLMSEAFRMKSGESSAPIEVKGKSLYYIVNLAKVTPKTLRPLETVRDKVVVAMQRDQQRMAAETRAKELVARLNGGKSSDLAAAGLPIKASLPFTRDGRLVAGKEPKPSELPLELITELFKQQKLGKVVMARSKDDRAWLVAQVSDVRAGTPAANATMSREFTQDIQADLIAAYVNSLRDKYKVKLNQKLYEQYY